MVMMSEFILLAVFAYCQVVIILTDIGHVINHVVNTHQQHKMFLFSFHVPVVSYIALLVSLIG